MAPGAAGSMRDAPAPMNAEGHLHQGQVVYVVPACVGGKQPQHPPPKRYGPFVGLGPWLLTAWVYGMGILCFAVHAGHLPWWYL